MKLEIRNLTKAFGGVHAIEDVTLGFDSGSLSAVIGPNGAGKSTFFNLISGAFPADRGQVLLDGEDVIGLSRVERMKRGIGRAFQVASCFPTMTVRENVQVALVSYGRQLFNVWGSTPQVAREEAGRLLELVGMSGYAERPCGELAYGDLKRLELAIALANQRGGKDNITALVDEVLG